MGSCLSNLYGLEEEFAWARAVDSRINYFGSSALFKLHLNNLKDSSHLVVIDFFTYWCGGPFKLDHSVMRNMADRFTDVEYIKIHAFELIDVAEEFQVHTMPTFVLLKKGKEVDRVVDADEDLLQEKIQKHRALQP